MTFEESVTGTGYILISALRLNLIQNARSVSRGEFIATQVLVPTFYILTAIVIGNLISAVEGNAYFSSMSGFESFADYIIVGFAFSNIVISGSWAGVTSIRSEQDIGTAELIFASPGSKFAWILGKIVGQVIFVLPSSIAILMVFLGYFHISNNANPLLLFISVAVAVVSTSMLSYALSTISLIFRRSRDLYQVLWPSIMFFCGLGFPVGILPQWAQTVSFWIPLTHALNIIRASMLSHSLGQVEPLSELVICAFESVFYLAIGATSFHFSWRLCRRRGEFMMY